MNKSYIALLLLCAASIARSCEQQPVAESIFLLSKEVGDRQTYCNECNENIFCVSDTELAWHVEAVHLRCRNCRISFASAAIIKEHLKAQHPEWSQNPNPYLK
jgi:uncharacterized protein with PIN domain